MQRIVSLKIAEWKSRANDRFRNHFSNSSLRPVPNSVARLRSTAEASKQLHFAPSNDKQNTWTLGNLRTRQIREIAADGHMPQTLLRINVF
jgi:hypothetical protein